MAERLLDNFIEGYLVYTNESRSPEEYHRWVALSMIAGALRRRVFYQMGYFTFYPNLYVVLVGPPGRCKKSTAMRTGRDILGNVPDIKFTTDSVTRERLIQDLSQAYSPDGHSSMTAYSSEFATLFASSGMEMVNFLTDIYDSPPKWEHASKSGGKNTIKGPYLNLLGGTIPDWISRALPLDSIGFGFTSRIVFVYQDTPRVRASRPRLTQAQMTIKEMLVHDMQMMSLISGEYVMTPEAGEFYDAWDEGSQMKPNQTNDPKLDGYYERKPGHVIKLSMVMAASKRNALVIEKKDIEDVLELLMYTESNMTKVFANVGKNPLNIDYAAIGEYIYISKGANFAEILTKFKYSVRKEELSEVLDTLVAMGAVMLKDGKFVPTT